MTAVRPVAFKGRSSFATGRLEVEPESGATISVFMRDLDPDHQLDEAKLVREPTLDRSRREVHKYRDVLSSFDRGTPALYGVHLDEWAPLLAAARRRRPHTVESAR